MEKKYKTWAVLSALGILVSAGSTDGLCGKAEAMTVPFGNANQRVEDYSGPEDLGAEKQEPAVPTMAPEGRPKGVSCTCVQGKPCI